jgi:RimJ/RimL family protein N-acetyltransferase/acyl carrier protein
LTRSKKAGPALSELIPHWSLDPHVGIHVRLAPVEPSSYRELREIEIQSSFSDRWRFRDQVPSPSAYSSWIWQDVLSQFLIVERASDRLIGLVEAYEFRSTSGTVKVSLVTGDAYRRSGFGVAGLGLFLDILFRSFPIRKVYFEVLEDNWLQFSHFVDWLGEVEAVLHDHVVVSGRLQSLTIATIFRNQWEEFGAPLIEERLNLRAGCSRSAENSVEQVLVSTPTSSMEHERSCGLRFDEFVSRLVREIDGTTCALSHETSLWEDLQWDSFDAIRMIIWVESVSGALVPEPDVPSMQTLGEVYEHYLHLREVGSQRDEFS